MKHYGEQKWALIAEKMAGRAGKQCRERWRNHLRPDIKVLFMSMIFVLHFMNVIFVSVNFNYKDLHCEGIDTEIDMTSSNQ